MKDIAKSDYFIAIYSYIYKLCAFISYLRASVFDFKFWVFYYTTSAIFFFFWKCVVRVTSGDLSGDMGSYKRIKVLSERGKFAGLSNCLPVSANLIIVYNNARKVNGDILR